MLTDEQLEKVQTQLAVELLAQLPRKQELKVSLLGRRGPAKKSDDNVNANVAGDGAEAPLPEAEAVSHPGDAE